MSFAPPKQTTPPNRVSFGEGSLDPVRGRLARAATGHQYDVSEDVTVSPGGTRRLWLVESDRAPRSPGVATVAAVSSEGQYSTSRTLPFGTRSSASHPRSNISDKGPAFAHLLRQNELLSKRLNAAHSYLAKAFGGGKETTYMTTTLRMKSGAHALKCVAEAVPLGDALLANWDSAWGLQLQHLTRTKERAEGDLERARRQTEAALAEAEAAHSETEAYQREMDANVDRIERAKANTDELRDAKRRAEHAEERAAKASDGVANAVQRAADADVKARSEAEKIIAQLREDLAETKANLKESENQIKENRILIEKNTALLNEKSAASGPAADVGQESNSWEMQAREISEEIMLDASQARAKAEARVDVAEAKLVEAEEKLKIAEAEKRTAEIEAEAERQNARLNREETKKAQELAAEKQMTLQDKVIALQDELSSVKSQLEECRGALAGAAASGDVGTQVRKMEQTSRQLRRELLAAERVRFAARIVAEDTQRGWIQKAADGDDAALDERSDRAEAHLVVELASRVAEMQGEMKNMRASERACASDAGADGHHNTDAPATPVTVRSHPEHASETIETLRSRLVEANAHVAVLATSRDKALLESARCGISYGVAGVSAFVGAESATRFAQSTGAHVGRAGSAYPASVDSLRTPGLGIPAGVPAFAAVPAPWPSKRLEAARLEAERLVQDAESAGREAFNRLKSASAALEAKPGRGGGLGRGAARQGVKTREGGRND